MADLKFYSGKKCSGLVGISVSVQVLQRGYFCTLYTYSNGKSSIVEERILRFVFDPSIVEERILRFVCVPSIVEEQILRFVFVPSIVEEQILWFVFVPLIV